MRDLLTAFRAPEVLRPLADQLAAYAGLNLTIMEVCGTHTMSIMRYGVKGVLPSTIRLVSGPGCPVCVTPSSYIDMAIELAAREDVVIASFGDLLRVPGSRGSLMASKSAGSDIRIVYSPLDCLALCEAHPDKRIVFLSVGIETTVPASALLVMKAIERGIGNLSLLTANKTMPAALEALVADTEVRVNGFILPGHVCTIAGTEFYAAFCARCGIAGVIAGFEPADLLGAILAISRQASGGVARLDNLYTRVVKPEGNTLACTAVATVFEPCDAAWRGLGVIPDSGLRLRDAYAAFDAQRVFKLVEPTAREPAGCLCSEILKGKKTPEDCPLFGTVCEPASPVGACMVSTEGTCAAYYKYR